VYLGHVTKFGADRKDAPIRLFRNGCGQFQTHQKRPLLRVEAAKVDRLKSKLMHFLCWNVTEWINACDEQTSQSAALRHERGDRPRLARAVLRAARQFAGNYIGKHGWLDGKVGLQLSLFAALSVLTAEAKLWELHAARRLHDPAGEKPALGMRLFRNTLPEDLTRQELRRAS
jgi:hypothetical protein